MAADQTVRLRQTGETPASADGARMRALTYDILADGRRVGVCELRPEPTWAARLSGQVSYTVFPPCRGHHYALRALRLLCAEARVMGADSLIVTCRPDNAASRRTLDLAGAALDGTEAVPPEHPLARSGIRQVCVYKINLTRHFRPRDRNEHG